MIIVKLMGGLGNQMFQYAAARAYTEGTIYLDLTFFRKNNKTTDSFTARKYELEIFDELDTKKLNGLLARMIVHTGKLDFFKKIFPKRWKNFKIINDNNYYKIQDNSNCILDGYFQNEEIFLNNSHAIKKAFTFPQIEKTIIPILNEIKNRPNSVAIHVRRGDYLKASIGTYHPPLDIEYYKRGIDILSKKFENLYFFIFSDDPEWCLNAFTFLLSDYKIVKETNRDWEAMYLMSICKHNIIANSSFSWWAAWLNSYDDKIVIAPETWFKLIQNPASKSWIKI